MDMFNIGSSVFIELVDVLIILFGFLEVVCI